jgi:hypothetical protein
LESFEAIVYSLMNSTNSRQHNINSWNDCILEVVCAEHSGLGNIFLSCWSIKISELSASTSKKLHCLFHFYDEYMLNEKQYPTFKL